MRVGACHFAVPHDCEKGASRARPWLGAYPVSGQGAQPFDTESHVIGRADLRLQCRISLDGLGAIVRVPSSAPGEVVRLAP